MAAPNMNGRLHLSDVHQNSPASFLGPKALANPPSMPLHFNRNEEIFQIVL